MADDEDKLPLDPEGRREWVEALNDELRFLISEGKIEGFLQRLARNDCRELLLRRIKYHSGGAASEILISIYEETFKALAVAFNAGEIGSIYPPLNYILAIVKTQTQMHRQGGPGSSRSR